jgi:hypothetical protein
MEYYKKIDKSFFQYGVITIPLTKIKPFLFGKKLKKGDSREIFIRWKGKKTLHRGLLFYSKRGIGKNDFYQIKWGVDSKLNVEFKNVFIQTYMAIMNQKYTAKPKGKYLKTNLLGGVQEVLIFRPVSINEIELETFIKIETPYDGIFKKLVEQDVFGWIDEPGKDYLITKSSKWHNIDELRDHADTPYVIYYLIDENNKEIYIGSAKRLGDRVKPGRKEIPGWTKFKYDIVHKTNRPLLKRIEFQAIRTFASFFDNVRGEYSDHSPISDYKLVNKIWPKRK